MSTLGHRRVWAAVTALSAASCADWTERVIAPGAQPAVHVEEGGEPCFDVVVHASGEEAEQIVKALHGVCKALRDPALEGYLAANQDLLYAGDRRAIEDAQHRSDADPRRRRWRDILDPRKLGGGALPDRGAVAFHVVAADLGEPGISEICVKSPDASAGDPRTRALAVSRKLRLAPRAGEQAREKQERDARLVNTIAHELMHLHSKGPGRETCFDLFNDDGASTTQCHNVTYVVGNAAACVHLQQTGNQQQWRDCMTNQAELTPGRLKGPSSERDALGCPR